MFAQLRFGFLLFAAMLFIIPDLSAFQNQPQPRDEDLLANPRRAVHTFLHWQQSGHKNPDFVIKTMKLSDAGEAQKLQLASELLKVLDARGLLIDYDQIPANPNYTDSLSGLQQYILFSSLPEVYLIKSDQNQWVFSEATINRIPELYDDTFSGYVTLITDNLPNWAHNEWLGIEIWQYIAVFIWLLTGLILMKVFGFILDNYVKRLAQKTKFTWDDDLINSIEKPAAFIFLMIFFLLTYSNLQFSVNISYYLSAILEIVVSVGVVWLLYNLADVFSQYLSVLTSKTETQLDDQLVPLIRKTLRFFVVLMGVIAILQNNGYNVASLIAGLGIGGLAVALAARETLANFFGSVTILLDRPFKMGDWIKVGDVEGTVEEVGFRSTRVRTFYNSLVSVPNSNLANTDIDNLGLRQYRRLKTALNLTYSTTPEQMEAFVEGIKAIVKANKHFRQDMYEVHFNSFGAHSLDVLVYVFFDVPDWSTELQQRHNFFLEVLKLAKELGVEFAFPTQTLHMDSFYKDEPRKAGEDRSEEELASAVYQFGPDGEKKSAEGTRIFKDGEEIDFGANK
ncbi:MAG: mechanosensitive ion channel family protein [Gracilimonas sp.]|uniref:mechanosensitive ion channel family protein n=2 Tax=Balneolaceae TaxID=1813606 RepID=UPI001B13E4CA|nr:mechanosensitive ion channel family protein [Gracilimonas sp.]MBO6585343.1 mechanosensitive ion channel family protein [Gracilimonas sp.]MBO6616339.1 mechanosensitive ion channel family protein [Gracilimonas sp.]